jgi:hypothetical protein
MFYRLVEALHKSKGIKLIGKSIDAQIDTWCGAGQPNGLPVIIM